MRPPPFQLDKARVAASFEAAAPHYDQFAKIQRLIGERVLERLDAINIAPSLLVDLGAGTGYCARLLAKRYRKARVLLLDIAPAMLVNARRAAPIWRPHAHYLCADAETLPIRDASVDIIFSNLTIQWCNDLEAVFAECRRILKPRGLILFSTLGPDTLHELRAAWFEVNALPHVHVFSDMHDVGDALVQARLSSPLMETETLTVIYEDAASLMRDLKALGAHNAFTGRPRGLSGSRTIETVTAAYEKFRTVDGLPATYEVVYGHAWCPTADTRPQDGSTVATFPFDRLTVRR